MKLPPSHYLPTKGRTSIHIANFLRGPQTKFIFFKLELTLASSWSKGTYIFLLLEFRILSSSQYLCKTVDKSQEYCEFV